MEHSLKRLKSGRKRVFSYNLNTLMFINKNKIITMMKPVTLEEIELEEVIIRGGNVEAFLRYNQHKTSPYIEQGILDDMKSMIFPDSAKINPEMMTIPVRRTCYKGNSLLQACEDIVLDSFNNTMNLGLEALQNFYSLVGLR